MPVLAADYQLLAPIPGVGGAGDTVPSGDFAGYAQGLITFIIGFSAVLAVLWFMFGGFLYMTGEAISSKSQGREYMLNAVYGLVLLLASYLILYTINPQLVNLNLEIDSIGAPAGGGNGGGTGGGPTGGINTCYRYTLSNGTQSACYTLEECSARSGGSTCLLSSNTGSNDSIYYSPEYGKNITCADCVALSGVPIKPNQCKGEVCQVNSELAQKLQSVNETVQGWQVTEAWPPTVQHKNVCHQNGSCVDVNFTNGFSPIDPNSSNYEEATKAQAASINSFANAATNAGFGATAIVYEVKTSARKEELLGAGVVPGNVTIAVVPQITAEHFSVYNR